ncbi:hypothetical protein [Leifsonia sp. 22587]|uniref:hypothetical protein n=1 Tax=Leifsonia sp. 22587 TaxID=3453946 RepID=UPI003F83F567
MPKLAKVTDDDIAEASAALDAGRKALEEAREAYFDERGDWQTVEDLEATIRRAEAALVRLERSKVKYDEEVRQGQLAELRREIDAFSLSSGDEFSKLLDQAESAIVAFATAFQTRNEKLNGWAAKMKELGVPPLGPTRLVPPASEVGLGWGEAYGDVDLQAGERKFRRLHSGRFLTSLLVALGAERNAPEYYFDSSGANITDIGVLHDQVAKVDHEVPGIPDDAVFFRTASGGLIWTDEEHAFTQEVQRRDHIQPISREEALNG